eukprot:scaffold114641_cov33-Phaeocystis_antarctica.AAC.1
MAPDHDLARQREGHGAGRELRPSKLPVVAVGGREDKRELELGDAAHGVRLVGRLLDHDVGRVHGRRRGSSASPTQVQALTIGLALALASGFAGPEPAVRRVAACVAAARRVLRSSSHPHRGPARIWRGLRTGSRWGEGAG